MKIKVYPNDWSVTLDKMSYSGMYLVQCRSSSGDIFDKVRLDNYIDAMHYYKSFCAIAKNK